MAHFAHLDENNIVDRVIVADQDFINSGAVGDAGRWVQTSFNTHAGKHRGGGKPLRKNFAGIGYKYDGDRDAFIPPKPHKNARLNERTCTWED